MLIPTEFIPSGPPCDDVSAEQIGLTIFGFLIGLTIILSLINYIFGQIIEYIADRFRR